MFSLRQNASKTPKWVRSGAVAGDGQLSSRHEVDPGRGSGSPREASAELSTVPPVCSLPFGAPMPRRHGSSNFVAPKAHFREVGAGYCARIFACPGIEVRIHRCLRGPVGEWMGLVHT